MTICPTCKQENPDEARFCNACGGTLSTTCAKCGHANPPSSRFCNHCGSTLSELSRATEGSRFSSPAHYTPKHLAERILVSRAALEGERKQVTVLFADLKGSMELLADRDPEQARNLLAPVVEQMIEAVHRYEGTVNQVMGDGIMALFGAPIALEDHAVRACYAALAMQSSLRAYSDEIRRSHGTPPLQIRVGLNSGEVVVGAIGSDLRMEYTAVGQTTHLAARMEQLAAPGTTLMSAATLQLVEGFVLVKVQGPVPVKGLAEPVEVYELTGAAAARTRLQAAAVRGLTQFVGRADEVAQLNRVLEQAGAGHGQIAALVGEPGVGKSRLVWEFTRSHRAREWLVLESGSVSYGKASAYRPAIDLLKAYFQIASGDDARRIREKVTGKLLALDETLRPMLVPVLALLETPLEDPAWSRLDPAQRRLRTLEACKRLMLREAQVQPLILVFEDLHWIDTETQAFLDGLVESLPTVRILLLVNYRPEYQNRWTTKTYYTQLRIDPLQGESAEALLHTLVGPDPSLLPLKRLLIERTEGNPLFLEESVRTLVETGALQGDRGTYRLAGSSASIRVPATVQAIIASRIDRLEPDDKRLLQAAAVIGKDVPYALLLAIAELSQEQLSHALTDLQTGEFLYEASLFPDLEYTFKHALTHEVAYAGVLQERRRALHGRIMQAVERIYVARLTDQLERLAHHALRAEIWDKALQYLRGAGEKAFARSANRQAADAFEQALGAAARLPQSMQTLQEQVDLTLLLRIPLVTLGEMARYLDYARKGERLASMLGDRLRHAWTLATMSQACSNVGELTEAFELANRALLLGRELGDRSLLAATHYYMGSVLALRGEYRRGADSFSQHDEAPTSSVGDLHSSEGGAAWFAYRSAALNTYVWAKAFGAWCLAELGLFDDAIASGMEAQRAAAVLGITYAKSGADGFLGFVYLRKGELDRAVALLEACLRDARASDMPVLVVHSAPRLSSAYNLEGRCAESIALLEEVRDMADASNNMHWLPLLHAHLGQAYVMAGKLEDGIAEIQHALALARQHRERGYEAWSLYFLGEAFRLDQSLDAAAARRHYGDALAIAQALEMRPLEAQCELGLGQVFGRSDDARSACEHCRIAAEMFREMGMTFWLEKTKAALILVENL